MATLKLERGGAKGSLMNKFKVHIDGEQVGELKKYGDTATFEVSPGPHTIAIKAFGGVRGTVEIEFTEGDARDLLTGYPSFTIGVIQGVTTMSGTLGFWERED